MASIKFLSAGTEETQDRLLFSANSGSSSSATDQAHTGTRSIKCDSTGSNAAAWVERSGIMADAGRRVSFWLRFSALPATSPRVLSALTSGSSSTVISVDVRSTGKISLETNTTNYDGTTVLSVNTWYRVTFCYTITSTTVNAFKIYINGNLEVNQSNITIGNTGSDVLRIGMVQAFGASKQVWVDDLYVDDGTDLADPGNICCTVKQYVGTSEGSGFNDWDTFVGTTRSNGSRYLNVSERPDSDTNGWEQAGTSQVYEKYLIQDAATGDLDISTATIVGRMAWVRAKTSASSSAASIVDNDTDTTISTTTVPNQFFHCTTDSSYPTGRFGMRSTGTATDTFFYEGGVVIAYVPGPTPKALSVTSSSTLARALSATKSPAAFAQSDTTRTITKQVQLTPTTSSQSDTTRNIKRQTQKIAVAASSAVLAYGPTAVARALTLASAGLLARVADVTHALGPLHVDGITPALTRQPGKTPQATSSGTPTRDPLLVGKVPVAQAVGVLDRVILATQSRLLFTSRAVQDRLIGVGKSASASASSTLDLLAESLGNTYMQALDAASSAGLALLRAVGLFPTGSSTATATRALTAGKTAAGDAAGSPVLAPALTVLRALAATSTAGADRLLTALKVLAATSTATGTRAVLVGAVRSGAATASAMLQAGAQTAYSALLAATSSAGQSIDRAVAFTVAATTPAVLATQKVVGVVRLAGASGAGLLAAARQQLAALVASATGAGLLTRAAEKSLTAASAGSAGRTVAVGSVRAALGTGLAALGTGASFVYSATLNVASTASSALVRGVAWERQVASVGVGALERGVAKLLSLVATGLAGLGRLRNFRPGRPPAVNRRAVSLAPTNTGDVTLQPTQALTVSIKEGDHADV